MGIFTEDVQKFGRNVSKQIKSGFSSSSSSEIPYNSGGRAGVTATLSSSDESRLLVARAPRNAVSLWTCSKLCAIFFVAGVVFGSTLRKRVRRWASRLLRRLKDD